MELEKEEHKVLDWNDDNWSHYYNPYDMGNDYTAYCGYIRKRPLQMSGIPTRQVCPVCAVLTQ